MGKFFKNFGLGIVYVLLLPALVTITIIIGAYGLFLGFFETIRGIARFFKGESFFPSLHEDREVAMIAKAQHDKMLNGVAPEPKVESTPAPAQNTTYVQNNYYQNKGEGAQTPNPALGQNHYSNPQVIDNKTSANPTPISQNSATYTQIPSPSNNEDPEPITIEVPSNNGGNKQ